MKYNSRRFVMERRPFIEWLVYICVFYLIDQIN